MRAGGCLRRVWARFRDFQRTPNGKQDMELQRSSGIVLHRPRCPAAGSVQRPTPSWTGSRPQDRAGGRSSARPTPDDVGSPYAASSAFAAWSGFLAEPDAPVSSQGARGVSPRERYWIADWERAGGAQPTRFGSTASGRLCASTRRARHQADRRRPDLRRSRQRRPRDPPGALSEGALAGAPPDKLGPEDSTGATRSSTGTRLPGRATAGGSSGCVGRSRSSTSPGSIHFRGFAAFWAIPAGPDELDALRPLASRARRVGLPRGRGRARRAAGDRRGSRHDHQGRRSAPRRSAAWSCSSGRSRGRRAIAPAREPPRAPGDLHDNPRHGHVARGHLPDRDRGS